MILFFKIHLPRYSQDWCIINSLDYHLRFANTLYIELPLIILQHIYPIETFQQMARISSRCHLHQILVVSNIQNHVHECNHQNLPFFHKLNIKNCTLDYYEVPITILTQPINKYFLLFINLYKLSKN